MIKKSIIVIDDCATVGETMCYFLRKTGHRTLYASDRGSLINILQDHTPDAVISDWHIEDNFKGYDVANMVKDLPQLLFCLMTSDDKITENQIVDLFDKNRFFFVQKSAIMFEKITHIITSNL